MERYALTFRGTIFRQRSIALIVLGVFVFSLFPSGVSAQRPTATVLTVQGQVLVSGLPPQVGSVLAAGDVLETQADSAVVLELSDSSQVKIGENTQIDLAELSQTSTGARTSRLKLVWGWFRAKLSPGHQADGSEFEVETPNAVIGVKFSQPDIEVSYDPQEQETVGIAHTMELLARNLVTDEELLVPVGSTVIIRGTVIQIVDGTGRARPFDMPASDVDSKSGLSKTTLIAAGGLAAAGGITAAVLAGGGDDSSSSESLDFTGVYELTETAIGGDTITIEISLTVTAHPNILGLYSFTQKGPNCDYWFNQGITGQVDGSTANLTLFAVSYPEVCGGFSTTVSFPDSTRTCTLENSGNLLHCTDPNGNVREYQRQ